MPATAALAYGRRQDISRLFPAQYRSRWDLPYRYPLYQSSRLVHYLRSPVISKKHITVGSSSTPHRGVDTVARGPRQLSRRNRKRDENSQYRSCPPGSLRGCHRRGLQGIFSPFPLIQVSKLEPDMLLVHSHHTCAGQRPLTIIPCSAITTRQRTLLIRRLTIPRHGWTLRPRAGKKPTSRPRLLCLSSLFSKRSTSPQAQGTYQLSSLVFIQSL